MNRPGLTDGRIEVEHSTWDSFGYGAAMGIIMIASFSGGSLHNLRLNLPDDFNGKVIKHSYNGDSVETYRIGTLTPEHFDDYVFVRSKPLSPVIEADGLPSVPIQS